MRAVWESSKQEGGGLLLMLAIADFADDAGIAFPSMERLANKARLTQRRAQQLIADLVKSGELAVERGGGKRRTNTYRVTLKSFRGITPKSFRGINTAKGEILSAKGEISGSQTLKPASPSTTSYDPSVIHHIDPSGEFERFFSDYPRKENKKAARQRVGEAGPRLGHGRRDKGRHRAPQGRGMGRPRDPLHPDRCKLSS